MKALLIFLYRYYCFYASPAKRIIRRTVYRYFKNTTKCSKVLEVGGGNAMMRNIIKRACLSDIIISTDIDPSDQTDAVCDGQCLPFSSECVDLVVAFEVIEHIPNSQKFFSELTRVLKPYGYIILSWPFLYGRHDYQDYYRWTDQGIMLQLKEYGFTIRTVNNRGGTFLSIITLLTNYIHSKCSPSTNSWRAKGSAKNIYYGVMTIIMFPLNLIGWLSYGLDLLVDHKSANPSGYVVIAQKSID